jgi:hypothetical protein
MLQLSEETFDSTNRGEFLGNYDTTGHESPEAEKSMPLYIRSARPYASAKPTPYQPS